MRLMDPDPRKLLARLDAAIAGAVEGRAPDGYVRFLLRAQSRALYGGMQAERQRLERCARSAEPTTEPDPAVHAARALIASGRPVPDWLGLVSLLRLHVARLARE
ncbi:MAG: hypothetical protein KBD01_17165 [Acidobacteria bacterium]|nr:hypothetical protein [Acidobacteriota bacterium]